MTGWKTWHDWLRVGDAVQITYDGDDYIVKIDAGRYDEISVFTADDGDFFIVAIQSRIAPGTATLTFVDLYYVDPDRRVVTDEFFDQVHFGEWQADEILGEDWERFTPMTIAKKLSKYLP